MKKYIEKQREKTNKQTNKQKESRKQTCRELGEREEQNNKDKTVKMREKRERRKPL